MVFGEVEEMLEEKITARIGCGYGMLSVSADMAQAERLELSLIFLHPITC